MIVLTEKPSHNRHTLDCGHFFEVRVQSVDRFTEEALPFKNLAFIGEEVW